MKTWLLCGAGLLAVLGLSPRAFAVTKGLGQVQAAQAAAGAAGVPAAPPGNLLGMLCPTPEQLEACRMKFCNSPLGKLINNGLKPISLFSGGILGNCCPPEKAPSLADQMKPGAEGLAARIQAEEANAKARRAAARYLGTVDCHVFAGVDKELVGLLRKDTNECVRLEAALALGRGCCCNKVTIQGLALTVSGSEKDGNRSEKSERVRQAAAASLAHCLGCVGTAPPQTEEAPRPRPEAPPKAPEKPETPDKLDQLTKGVGVEIQLSAYYRQVESLPFAQILEDARKALAEYQEATTAASQPGNRSVAELVAGVISGPSGAKPSSAQTVTDAPLTPTPATPPATSEPPMVVTPVSVPAAPKALPLAIPTQPAAPAPRSTSMAPPSQTVTSLPVVTTAAKPTLGTPHSQHSVQVLTVSPKAQVGVPATVATRVPMTTGAVSGVNNVSQLLMVLRESIYPEQREWAAARLTQADQQAHPQIAAALVKSAREDTAPSVQVTCIRCLVQLNCKSPEMASALQALAADSDPRVRQEAAHALSKLGAQPVVPASYVPSRQN